MEEGLIRITPDKEKAKSIVKMAKTTLEMIGDIDLGKFSSNVTKEYYDVMRELISVILLLDGYKTFGEGAHKRLVDYLQKNYGEFEEREIALIDELRLVRNRIAYDGFFVSREYIERKREDIRRITAKLENIIKKKLGNEN